MNENNWPEYFNVTRYNMYSTSKSNNIDFYLNLCISWICKADALQTPSSFYLIRDKWIPKNNLIKAQVYSLSYFFPIL